LRKKSCRGANTISWKRWIPWMSFCMSMTPPNVLSVYLPSSLASPPPVPGDRTTHYIPPIFPLR